ncbi:MAG TPA: CorA family divalent cation transporter [Eubacteriales bacterium]|nr:CorA family divalent cation transporter [Eubacteriales bacterium]
MIYEFGETLKPVDLAQVDETRLTAGMVALEEMKQGGAEKIGLPAFWLDVCEKPESHFRSVIETADGYLFSLLSVRSVSSVYGPRDKIGFFVERNFLLLITVTDADGSTTKAFEEAMHRLSLKNVSLERIICAFFERLVYRDTGALETYENRIGKMEEQIENGTTGKAFNGEILALRRKLLVVRHYYEQLLDLLETMIENDADLFSDENAHFFRIMRDKVVRLSNNTQLLRDSLVQVREAYMAALDYSANRIMKVFTVVTTIFLPLTLIVGWYGMNFKFMPELAWRYGYAGVALLSVVVVIGGLLFFKKKKLL